MCGISAIINLNKSLVKESEIAAMNNRINHRGPNDDGIKIAGHVGLGHKRLSIIDLSDAGHQPMSKYNYDIIFNGEIYNYIEIRQTLIDEHNLTFESQSDTEVILAAYNVWGEDCVNRFNGMWSLVLLDHNKKKLFCSRDRFGIKPFVYGTIGEKFVIASETKQFIDVEGFLPKLSRNAAYNYLHNGLLNVSEETFFEGIKELRGGHNLIFDLASHNYSIIRWYNLNNIKKVGLNDEKANQNTFRELFKKSVELRLRSDVNLGSCLSGGLDSSSIVSVASDMNPKLETISSCYSDPRYDEQKYIDIVNKETKTKPNKVFPNMNDLLDKGVLEKIIYHQDQPISSGSNFSEFSVFKEAGKNGFTVMLDGQGADEYIAGYNEFFKNYWWSLLKKLKIKLFIEEIGLFSQKRNRSKKQTLQSFFNFLFIYRLKSFVKNILGKDNTVEWLEAGFIRKCNSKFKIKERFSNLKELSIYELDHISIPYQLHSEDRNSMFHSIESRLPFLDYRLVEFCLNLPDNQKINKGESKSILRKSLSNELPAEILTRYDKMGFVAPDEVWIRENAVKVRAELEHAVISLKGIINDKILVNFDKMISKETGFSHIYFRVISLATWKSVFKAEL